MKNDPIHDFRLLIWLRMPDRCKLVLDVKFSIEINIKIFENPVVKLLAIINDICVRKPELVDN